MPRSWTDPRLRTRHRRRPADRARDRRVQHRGPGHGTGPGTGSVNPPAPGYLEGLQRTCRENDILLIVAEPELILAKELTLLQGH